MPEFSCPCVQMDIMSLSVSNTLGEINQIQYEMNQSDTVRNKSLKEGLDFGSYFCVVTSNLPLPAANSIFQVFPTKVACHAALQHVSTTNCTLFLQYQIQMVTMDESLKSLTQTRMIHSRNTPRPGTSAWLCLCSKQTWSCHSESWSSPPSRWVSILGPEPDAGSRPDQHLCPFIGQTVDYK